METIIVTDRTQIELAMWKSVLREVLGQDCFAAVERVVLDQLSLGA